MENVWVLASVWVGLALIATLLAIWFKISTALSEIGVGTVAQLVIGAFFVHGELGAKTSWISFLAGTGAIVLTFLAGAELDPQIFRIKWKEATVVGLVGFFGPFLGCTAIAHFILHWTVRSSWLAGVALCTTSVAVVYAVMLELGFNVTDFGKAVLAACFINDLGTVIALGLIFSPFTIKTLIFVGVSVVVFAVLPFLTPRFFKRYGGTLFFYRTGAHQRFFRDGIVSAGHIVNHVLLAQLENSRARIPTTAGIPLQSDFITPGRFWFQVGISDRRRIGVIEAGITRESKSTAGASLQLEPRSQPHTPSYARVELRSVRIKPLLSGAQGEREATERSNVQGHISRSPASGVLAQIVAFDRIVVAFGPIKESYVLAQRFAATQSQIPGLSDVIVLIHLWVVPENDAV